MSFLVSISQQGKHVAKDSAVIADEDSVFEKAPDEEDQKYFLNNVVFESEPDTIQFRRVPDSMVKILQNDDAFWYANAKFEKSKSKEISPSEVSPNPSWFKTLLWIIIIGGFTAVLIWYLAVSNFGIFSKSPKVIASADIDTETENIFDIEYQKEIGKAIGAGNYRLAIRLMFLQLLKNLVEKQVIEYKQERTNLDYLLQLQNTGYYKDFFRITRNYEYAWYGQFSISPEAFAIIRNDFENFTSKISRV